MVQCPVCHKMFKSEQTFQKHFKKTIPCTGKMTQTAIEVTEHPTKKVTPAQVERHFEEIEKTQKNLDEPVAFKDVKALYDIVHTLTEKLPKNSDANARKIMHANEQLVKGVIRSKFGEDCPPIDDVRALALDLTLRMHEKNPKMSKEKIEQRAEQKALQQVKKQMTAYDRVLEKTKDPLKAGQAVFREREKTLKRQKMSTRDFQLQMEFLRLQQLQYEHLQREAEAKVQDAKVVKERIEYQKEQKKREWDYYIISWANDFGTAMSALTGYAFWTIGNPFGHLATYLENVGRFVPPEAITLPFLNYTLNLGWWFKEACVYASGALNWVIPKFALLAGLMSQYWIASAIIVTILVGLLTWFIVHFAMRIMYAKDINVGGSIAGIGGVKVALKF